MSGTKVETFRLFRSIKSPPVATSEEIFSQSFRKTTRVAKKEAEAEAEAEAGALRRRRREGN